MSLFLGKIHYWLFNKILWFENLEEEINKSNSPEYIEKVAREKLGMYLQNERVYVDSNK